MRVELQYQTNINCGNCINAVKGFLNEVEGIEEWKVDTADERKVLSVKGTNIEDADIIAVVEEAGFDIQPL